MNFHRPYFFARSVRWLYAGMIALVFASVAHAQPTEPGRWLLIFDTSVTMKKRLPATAEALKHFLATGADGQLQAGDSMAVWTYGRQLTASQFPVVDWQSERATTLGSNLVSFLRIQHYTNDSSFTPLQASLNRVIANSERLTIVIFCDGLSPMNFTPYDDGVNQNFSDGQAERKKSQQPFVVVLRTQLGKYVGCTVSFPPSQINLPPFPALPPPPPVNIASAAHSPGTAALPPAIPDLVIVGKKVGTNDNVAIETTPPPAKPIAGVTNQPAVTASVVPPPVKVETTPVPTPPVNISPLPVPNIPTVTKPVAAPPIVAVVTQSVVAAVAPVVTQAPPVIASSATTNMPLIAAPVSNDNHSRLFISIGVGLLLLAVGLVLIIVRANRRPHASLITSSMHDDQRRK